MLVAKLVNLSSDHLAETMGQNRVARATGGVLVPVCNPGIFFVFFYFMYGLVSMTLYTPRHAMSA